MTHIDIHPQQAAQTQRNHALAQDISAPKVPPRQNWQALSGKGLLDWWEDLDTPLMLGCFVVELQLPLPRGEVLIYHHSKDGAVASFSLFVAPNGDLSMFQRSGKSILRVGAVAAHFEGAQTLRLSYRYDATLRRWHLQLAPDGSRLAGVMVSGFGALPFSPRDMHYICEMAEKNPAVIWHGFCRNDDLPNAPAWIGARTPIDTPNGPVAAAHLRAGDVILTKDGPSPLRAVRHVTLPARGSYAPVVLRGPYYDKRCDVLVGAQQQIAISGYLVEYLFGCNTVRIAARDVVDGHTALAGKSRDVVKAVCLDISSAVLIGGAGQNDNRAGPCRISMILGREAQVAQLALPKLTSFETVALLRQMGRVVSKVA